MSNKYWKVFLYTLIGPSFIFYACYLPFLVLAALMGLYKGNFHHGLFLFPIAAGCAGFYSVFYMYTEYERQWSWQLIKLTSLGVVLGAASDIFFYYLLGIDAKFSLINVILFLNPIIGSVSLLSILVVRLLRRS